MVGRRGFVLERAKRLPNSHSTAVRDRKADLSRTSCHDAMHTAPRRRRAGLDGERVSEKACCRRPLADASLLCWSRASDRHRIVVLLPAGALAVDLCEGGGQRGGGLCGATLLLRTSFGHVVKTCLFYGTASHDGLNIRTLSAGVHRQYVGESLRRTANQPRRGTGTPLSAFVLQCL